MHECTRKLCNILFMARDVGLEIEIVALELVSHESQWVLDTS